jgi:hypothetical protein
MLIEGETPQGPGRHGGPRLLAVFSFRYDAHLVPDLLHNLAPVVDGWIAFDDRGATEAFSSEPKRRTALLTLARKRGADWVLPVDPDERLEDAAATRMPDLLAAPPHTVWTFANRELFTPTAYRVDGLWRTKSRPRLFSMQAGLPVSEQDLHAPWFRLGPDTKLRPSGLNLYHLKMLTPERRAARRDLYKHLDPEGRFQKLGYDYLADETGMELEEIPPGRGFSPPHREDGGLWMPAPKPAG